MRHVPLGNSSLEISEFVFGAGGIGGIGSNPAFRGKGVDPEDGLNLLDGALDLGITVIDTADVYAGGDSELTVGEWISTRQPRSLLVQTKTGGVSRAGRWRFDLSAEHIRRQLAQSVGRLGRVDLYLSHAPDPDTPLEETLEAFAAAQDEGLIRAFGMSNLNATLLESVLDVAARSGLPRPEWIQNNLSLLHRDDERDLLPLAVGEGIGYTPFSPLAGGVLSDRYLDGVEVEPDSRIAIAGTHFYPGMYTAENLARVTALRDLAREREATVAGMALAWLRAHPSVTAPIIAPSKPEHWHAVREALGLALDEEDTARINEIFT
jgi:aryl-alcohol dehydrogenase-like predicted oxidoreductase